MNEHFLTEIEIKQFKCFTDFKASGFNRVNLIGGKNNIGKTAFLEACYINVHSLNINTMITAICNIKFDRESLNILYGYKRDVDNQALLDSTKYYLVKSNLFCTEYSVSEKDALKTYHLSINDNSISVNSNQFSVIIENVNNVRVIDNFGWSDGGIKWAYEAIQKQDKENELNAFISEFDGSIESFKIIGEKPQCKTNGIYRDIVEFGDGLRHYISIICGIYACENGYLFVDEIDNGIHYTQLDRLWELILTLSKKTNCQVFAITHSKEMLESFARVSEKLEERDISYTLLVRNKQQEIKTISMDYEMLLNSLAQEHEVRGW
ncbi:MAG: AAA family ATPase [Methylobacter sp.]|nr:AAA family ATPase [Methylobacter sp.]MDP2427418.1 AAA family ATPase [Methylobacter sp.]MDP3055990.1 AAA family ATPase [Methylobacter sp.]MDP3363325.1 AAA family ATPase [Methylobacter sp.]MDZ4220068.1 AAA family ATPase [Methylobacter sp.]